MKRALYLGKILGARIFFHGTFIFLIAWIVVTGFRNNHPQDAFLWIINLALAVFAGIVLHELGHTMAARRYGIRTEDMTLLPIGAVTQFTPMTQKAREELVIGLAGPVMNLIAAMALLPFVEVHTLLQPESLKTINTGDFFLLLIAVNVGLGVFNLIPAFPMDGGRILRAILSFKFDHSTATRITGSVGEAIGIVVSLAGFLYDPLLIFFGLLIFIGSEYEYAWVNTMRLLRSFTVKDVLTCGIPAMDRSLTLRQAEAQMFNAQSQAFVVMDGPKPMGTVSRDAITMAVLKPGEKPLLENIANNKMIYATLSMRLDEAFRLMLNGKVPLLLVGTSGHLDGVILEDNLAEFIRLQSGEKIKDVR